MKKLVCLMLVALIGTVASAATIELQGPDSAIASEVITISLYSDTATGDFTLNSIGADVAGVASNGVVNPGFDWAMFTGPGTLNTGGFLVQNATGMVNFGSPMVSGDLYTFDYTVPADITGITKITFTAVGDVSGAAIGSCEVLVPEPMTIALLGLGGLFIRRRK